MLKVLLLLLSKNCPKSLSKELKEIVFIVEPSFDVKIDLICFSPTINDLITFTFSRINLGSGLPEPKGDNFSIF